MASPPVDQDGSAEVQPWQTKVKDQYGIGITLDTSRGHKRFKVRYRWHSKILNLGRFNDPHTARLAYDQAVAALAPGRKKTNYWPGTHQLNDPAVEAKLQQFMQDNPEAAAEALEARKDASVTAQAAVGAAGTAPGGTSTGTALAGLICWPGLMNASSSTQPDHVPLTDCRDTAGVSLQLPLQPSGHEPPSSAAGLPGLDDVDQGLCDWLLMVGPEHAQAGLHRLQARLPGQQQQQQQADPVFVPQLAGSGGSMPLTGTAAEASAAPGCLPPSGLLHKSASTLRPAYALMRPKSATQSRPHSYSTNLQLAGVSKPAGHRGHQALLTMSNGALADAIINTTAAGGGTASSGAGSPLGNAYACTGGSSSSSLTIDKATLLHKQSMCMSSVVGQVDYAGSSLAPADAQATAGQGQFTGERVVLPDTSLGSPASMQPPGMYAHSGLQGWPTSSEAGSYQHMSLTHSPASGAAAGLGAPTEYLGHAPSYRHTPQLQTATAYAASHSLQAGEQQQQQQYGHSLVPHAAASLQAGPVSVCSSGAAVTAATGSALRGTSHDMTADAASTPAEDMPMPLRQSMLQQLSMLLHMQEQQQRQEEQQRQAAAAARSRYESQLQQQQLMIQELQQQMAELQSLLLLHSNGKCCLTRSTPA